MKPRKPEKLTDREERIAHEAFMTGRVYASLGEKESPSEIHEKLMRNCIQSASKKTGAVK